MKERYLSKTPIVTFVYLSKFNTKLPGIFGNSKKRFLWTGLVITLEALNGSSYWKATRLQALIEGRSILKYFCFFCWLVVNHYQAPLPHDWCRKWVWSRSLSENIDTQLSVFGQAWWEVGWGGHWNHFRPFLSSAQSGQSCHSSINQFLLLSLHLWLSL